MFDKTRLNFLWFILGTMIFFLAASWLNIGTLVFSKSQVPNWFLTLLCLVTVWKIADLGREFVHRSRREAKEDIQTQKSQYQREKTPGGAVVWMFTGQPRHYACPLCFEDSIQILHEQGETDGYFECPKCKCYYLIRPAIPTNHDVTLPSYSRRRSSNERALTVLEAVGRGWDKEECGSGQDISRVQGHALYAAIRQAKAQPGSAEEFTRRIHEGTLPIVSNLAGFKAYYVVYGDDDLVTTVSIFEDQTAAEECNSRMMDWIQQHGGSMMAGPLLALVGMVIVHQGRREP